MSSLKLFLLGPPRIELEGVRVEIKRRKALALLTYLAVTVEAQRRDTLATLFWPDSDQRNARKALRRDLSILNKALAESWLRADWETVGLRAGFWLDIARFQHYLADCTHPADGGDTDASCLDDLTAAVALYQDDFLTGFTLPDCPTFDEWQLFQTESLRQALAAALKRLVGLHQGQGSYEAAIPHARRWLSLDPLHEPAHYQLMQLYAWSGQQTSALRQYERCRQTLDQELGLPPSETITDLYERIRSGRTGQKVEPPEHSKQSVRPRPTLPPQPTPFVGRTEELAAISRRLADPTCRLLTLVGPGGIGKTRLAVQAAQSLMDSADVAANEATFADGIYFVPLDSINAPAHLAPTIAAALNFTFYSDVEPQVQLLDYLREKEMLLVLDNFEHLLSMQEKMTGGETFVADMLTTAPGLKILATSREALNIRQEWLYPLDGLQFPSREGLEVENTAGKPPLEAYSAVQLFVQSARRVRPDFSFPAEQASVLKICRLVAGMPLGVELAAAWLNVLPCARIAQEIARSLDILTSRHQNVPARHRNMRAVFEHSWHLLSATEQRVLRRLSFFQGGCRLEAAEEVASAPFEVLAALVEKSLLRLTAAGRYQMHELLRQFSAEKLADAPHDRRETQNRHARYFIMFLMRRTEGLIGPQQQTALAEIRAELENVRLGWDWAAKQGWVEALDQALESLYHFYWIRSRFQEGLDAFETAAVALQTVKPHALAPEETGSEIVLGKVLARQGSFMYGLGHYEAAEKLLQKSLAIAQRLDAQAEVSFSLNFLGDVNLAQDAYTDAQQLYQHSLALSRKVGDQAGAAYTLNRLGLAAQRLGAYSQAKQIYRDSLRLSRALGAQYLIADSLNELGQVAYILGEYAESEQYRQESLAIFKAIGDQLGIARAIGGLGLIGLGGANLVETKSFLEKSLAICRETGHRLEIANRLAMLGHVTSDLGQYQEAQQYAQASLTICQEIGFGYGIIFAFNTLGKTSFGLGDLQASKEYLLAALSTAITGQLPTSLFETLICWATLLINEGDLVEADGSTKTSKKARAVELLALVQNHPSTWQHFKDDTAHLLVELEAELSPEVMAAARTRGESQTLEAMVAEILAEGHER